MNAESRRFVAITSLVQRITFEVNRRGFLGSVGEEKRRESEARRSEKDTQDARGGGGREHAPWCATISILTKEIEISMRIKVNMRTQPLIVIRLYERWVLLNLFTRPSTIITRNA